MENCHLINTLIAAGAIKFIIPFNKQAIVKDTKLYRLKIGSLIYLVIQTRLNIIYKISTLSRFLLNPSPQHIKATNQILQYLQGTRLLGIKYQGYAGNLKTLLYRYYNMDFVGDRSMQKSILGNIYFLTSKVISCLLKREQTVVQSTTKAEYYTLAKAVSKVLQLKQIMSQIIYLGTDIKSVRLYSNN